MSRIEGRAPRIRPTRHAALLLAGALSLPCAAAALIEAVLRAVRALG
ncbi:hypothetical protein [Roseivivax isoporae]|uniref:Uncharacterized protein n=1 Tax=Roseivivax isoporae LMG 25204 TaxID=1449351 RepID=X7F9P8_9RHOB|nr:hypothetical protein [Roseivivax isoporae]ETX28841.1 hypothetical protein RISW2_04490 [Roseivivax isoporae LMG 25204]